MVGISIPPLNLKRGWRTFAKPCRLILHPLVAAVKPVVQKLLTNVFWSSSKHALFEIFSIFVEAHKIGSSLR